MPVQFAFSEPSEGEYFEKYNQYNGLTLWFVLLFMLRSCAPYCLAVQVGFFETPKGIDSFFEHLATNITRPLFYVSECNKREKNISDRAVHVTKCHRENLVIEMSILRNTGFAIGAIISGVLSDLFGRRPISLWFSIIWFTFSLVLNFCTGRAAFSVVYVFTVAACAVVNSTTFVNFAEIAKRKNRILTIYTIHSYAFGTIVVVYVTNTMPNWHYMMAFNTANILVMIFASWYIPESPRWLLNKNKKKEAFKQLEDISGLLYDIEHIIVPSEIPSKKYEFVEMMKHIVNKKLKNFLLFIILTIVAFSFYLAGVWQGILHFIHTNDYILLHSWVEGVSFLFILPIYYLVGKRLELLIIYLLMAIASVACLASHEENRMVYFSIFSIFLGISAANLQWLYILYLFPTFIRNTMIGFYFCLWVLINICAVILIDRNEMGDGDQYYVIFLVMSCFGVVILFLPNVSKNELPNYKINF